MDILTQGLLNLTTFQIILATLFLTHVTIAAVTIYLHRHQSHRSLTLHPLISHFFRFWLWLTTGMVTKQWVAIHRKHHAKCETAEDPHSPQFYGLKTLLLQGSELYRREAANQETLDKFGKGTPDDWIERYLYTPYPFVGLISMLLLDILLFGVIGITVFAVQMVWIPIWAAGVINGVGHYWGYRSFEPRDASRNISPWGLFIGGEELHNNHHAYPASAKLSSKWWEFDIGWFYIRMLGLLRLARVINIAPKIRHELNKHLIDIDTVRAIVRNRFHVVKLYGRHVIKPVLSQERQRADQYCRSLYQRVRKLMTREDLRLDSTALGLINEATARSQTIATVYRAQQRLKDLWNSTTTHPQAKRVQRLQAWCIEAEQSGIKVLQEFAAYLRGFSDARAV
ncbi:MAG: fatty acid desaturase [Gammaproteobacteria bacterium]|nr:fatty acid desaturase [Gammaproteobacteria bacterium]